jgi:hypothetical protein
LVVAQLTVRLAVTRTAMHIATRRNDMYLPQHRCVGPLVRHFL